ncbi:MAG: acetate--CoA ligase [Elusimicrobia bacterium]|nr:acetate--CoA ligase [Elusimicrobiota bacterium]
MSTTTLEKPRAATKTLEDLLIEKRRFPPSKEFRDQANVKKENIYKEGARALKFWEKRAGKLVWSKKWKKVLQWKEPFAQWFVGGKLNASVNCVDRHLDSWRKTKAAIIWESEPGETRTLTYQQLSREVNRFANALKSLGVAKGDRAVIYMPMIPELPIAMLACARIGAAHSVVFGGFSAEALRDRINDCKAKVVITADGGYRRGNIVPLKQNTDNAVAETPSVEKVVVYRRLGKTHDCPWTPDRDVDWDELVAGQSAVCKPEEMDSEDLLYILYTSGTTGKPKGIMHTTAGYLAGVQTTTEFIFDLKDEDVYWCTADIGWVTGHSYIVYGPLANGATTVMYEGSPDWPDKDRFWAVIEKFGVTILYTAPTAIRTFMKWGEEYPGRRDLSTLRLLGSVGEPINPEAWVWYHKVIGKEKCPVVDTWWQTETGSILISPLPGLTALKPGSATKPFPGIEADVVDEHGRPVKVGAGYLIIKKPWPSMLRGIYGDPERYKAQYWSRFPGVYFAGDGAKRDKDGYLWLLGRVDDVLKVSGHRLSTMEIESALVDNPKVAEAAVIGRHHDIKENAIVAFVTLKEGTQGNNGASQTGRETATEELKAHVVKKIGSLARPDEIIFTAELPKTRSGKIMRRLLRDIAEGRAMGDTTTLADVNVVKALKEKYEHLEG